MARNPRPYTDEPLFLLVEGYSDLHVAAELLEANGVEANRFFIATVGGNSGADFRAMVRNTLRESHLRTIRALAAIVDSDTDASAAFQRVRGALADATGRDLKTLQPGEVRIIDDIRVGIFVVGDGAGIREMEDLAWQAWAESGRQPRLNPCVESYLNCAREAGGAGPHDGKTRLGALLAVLHPDDPRLGPACKAKEIPLDTPAFAPLRTFLKELAGGAGSGA